MLHEPSHRAKRAPDTVHSNPRLNSKWQQHQISQSPASCCCQDTVLSITTWAYAVCLVAQSCPGSLWPHGLWPHPVSSVHRILRQKYWTGLPYPTPRIFPDRNRMHIPYVSYIDSSFFNTSITWEAQLQSLNSLFCLSMHSQCQNSWSITNIQ